jgi:hypothetical protein
MRGATVVVGVFDLGDFAIAFPLSFGGIQRCKECPAPDESESYLKSGKFQASVFRVFREEETAAGSRVQGSGFRVQGESKPNHDHVAAEQASAARNSWPRI